MHPALVRTIVDTCEKRYAGGDCPTVPAPSVENLEDAVLSLHGTNGLVLDALRDVVDAQLGPQGSNRLGTVRTEEILLLLLRNGRRVRAHDRVWTIEIPQGDIPAVRAAGGFLTLDERKAARASRDY